MGKGRRDAVGEEVSPLDEIARRGAQRMIEAALEVELEQYISQLREHRDDRGHAQVVRNGRGQERAVTVGSGTMKIRAPVNDKHVVEGERRASRARSCRRISVVPRTSRSCCRCSTFAGFHGGLPRGAARAAGRGCIRRLSPSSITRLVSIWQDEYTAWKKRSLADCDYVYVWVDGVHFGVRLEDERLSALVIGARPDGTKEVVAVEDGYRESKDS